MTKLIHLYNTLYEIWNFSFITISGEKTIDSCVINYKLFGKLIKFNQKQKAYLSYMYRKVDHNTYQKFKNRSILHHKAYLSGIPSIKLRKYNVTFISIILVSFVTAIKEKYAALY